MSSIVFIAMIFIWIMIMNRLRRASGGGKNSTAKNSGASHGSKQWHSENLPGSRGKGRPARSSDGHVMKGGKDITCRQFGHNHPEWEEPATRYIVHDDPEDGYIILNGKKMRITEADKYENTI